MVLESAVDSEGTARPVDPGRSAVGGAITGIAGPGEVVIILAGVGPRDPDDIVTADGDVAGSEAVLRYSAYWALVVSYRLIWPTNPS